MKNFEKAYLKFLQQYKNEKWYEGAILCGSYATGNNDENSDIDIYIVSSDETDWRERGNTIVDGFVIEYFINPIKTIDGYFCNEKQSFERHTCNMFNQGIIIDDINGNVTKLIESAKNVLKVQPEINDFIYQINCYSAWERFDELESKFKKGEDIDLSFYYFLQCAFSTIAYNRGLGSFNINKLEKFLSDENFRTKYGIKKFFNEKEIGLITKCLSEKERQNKFNNAKSLFDYICKEFKFDINKFSLRSKI